MSARIVRFSPRAVFISEAPEGGWLVRTPRGHGWLHGARRSAITDARWLGRNYGLDVRELGTTSTTRSEVMSMDQQQRDNSGALFKNDRKETEQQPDYKGSLVAAGVEYQLSAWVKTAKSGQKYMSLAIKPKGATPAKAKAAPADPIALNRP